MTLFLQAVVGKLDEPNTGSVIYAKGCIAEPERLVLLFDIDDASLSRRERKSVGMGTVKESQGKLVFTGTFTDDKDGRALHSVVRDLGHCMSWRFASKWIEWHYRRVPGGFYKVVTKAHIVEVSPTYTPTSQGTRTIDTRGPVRITARTALAPVKLAPAKPPSSGKQTRQIVETQQVPMTGLDIADVIGRRAPTQTDIVGSALHREHRGLIVEGMATTGAATKHYDANDKGYWHAYEPLGAEFTLPMPLLWRHDRRKPIGTVLEATKSAAGIRIRAVVERPGTPGYDEALLRDVWDQIESGKARAFSVGPAQSKDSQPYWLSENQTECQRLGVKRISLSKRWTLNEVSVTPTPADTNARMASVLYPVDWADVWTGRSGQRAQCAVGAN